MSPRDAGKQSWGHSIDGSRSLEGFAGFTLLNFLLFECVCVLCFAVPCVCVSVEHS